MRYALEMLVRSNLNFPQPRKRFCVTRFDFSVLLRRVLFFILILLWMLGKLNYLKIKILFVDNKVTLN